MARSGCFASARWRKPSRTRRRKSDWSRAQRLNPEAEIGDFITDPLPPIDFGRIAAQTAKQVIVQKGARRRASEAILRVQRSRRRDRQRGSSSVSNSAMSWSTSAAPRRLLRRDEFVAARKASARGERVRAYIYDVRPGAARAADLPVAHPTRSSWRNLFAQEVPEIYDGIIEIKAVARDPGSRAKIAVISRDSGIDPVGACVGMRGSRVQAVVGELQGEKIDIVPWSPDPATFVVNALAPAEVAKVVMDEEQRRVEVVVPDDQLSLAIGRRGQNVRLASQLSGWDIDILDRGGRSRNGRTEELRSRSQMFIDALDIDEVIAHLLVNRGLHLSRGGGVRTLGGSRRHRRLRRRDSRRAAGTPRAIRWNGGIANMRSARRELGVEDDLAGAWAD